MYKNFYISFYTQVCTALFTAKGIKEFEKDQYLLLNGLMKVIPTNSTDQIEINTFIENFFQLSICRSSMQLADATLIFNAKIGYIERVHQSKPILEAAQYIDVQDIHITSSLAPHYYKKYKIEN